MKVLLYTGDLKLVSKSGVGEAVRHQKQIMERLGIPYTTNPKEEYDVVHINTIFPRSLLMSYKAHRQKKAVLYYAHSTMEDFTHSFKGSNFFAPLFKRWISHCYNTADVLATPTEYSKNLLKTYSLKPPIYDLSNGIDSDFFAPDEQAGARFRQKYGIPPHQKVVISVGHYIERKGITDFVEIARRLPQYEFYWFGYTNLNLVPSEIRKAITTAPDNLHFPGYVGRDELRDAYCGSDLFLFLTHEETEGIVLLEALSCGISVVVRDIPIYAQFLTHGVNAYKGKNLDAFVSLTDGVLNGKLPDTGVEGRKTACTRDIYAVGQKLLHIYEKMLKPEQCVEPMHPLP